MAGPLWQHGAPCAQSRGPGLWTSREDGRIRAIRHHPPLSWVGCRSPTGAWQHASGQGRLAIPHQALLGNAGGQASGLPRLLLRPDGELLAADEAAAGLVGRSREELVGDRLQHLARRPRDVSALDSALASVAAGQASGDVRVELARPGERPGVPVHLAWAVTARTHGAPAELTAFLLDRSEQHRLEARLRSTFEQSTLPQAHCDVTGTLVEVNQAFCRLLGRPEEQLTGRSVRDLDHRSDRGGADAALAELLRGERTVHQHERILAGGDGRPVPVLIDATLLRDGDGQPVGAAAYVSDLTRLRDVENRRHQQQEFFLALTQRASDVAIVTDAEGRILYVSPAVTTMLGFAAEDLLYEYGIGFVHPEDAPEALALFTRVVADGGAQTGTLRVRDAAGAWRWVEESVSNLLDTPVGGVVCNLRDISDQVHAEAALRASEARYRAIVDNADEGLWLTAPDGRGVYVNARLVEILGVPQAELLRCTRDEVLAGSTRRVLQARGPGDSPRTPERYELTRRHPDGTERILSVSESALVDEDARLEGWLAMVTDVTAARHAEQQLRLAALTDELTGLPNRASLTECLKQALGREGHDVAVLFVDLDRFKLVNDARGHAVGDELLRAVAGRLVAAARPGDTVARFGGDEFLVVSEGVDEREARTLGDNLLAALDEPFRVAGGEALLSASIGVALRSGSAATSAAALLRHADTAMYAAKLAGRSRVRVFDEALAQQAEDRFELGADLRRALVLGDLELHYQPVVDLSDGEVLGVEGLARWRHPRQGLVPPDRFVPLAEEIGLSARLDRWALRQAVRDTEDLRRRGVLAEKAYVAVNVSAHTLGDPALERCIDQHLEAGDITPDGLLIEVTESDIMTDASSAVALLHRLRERGIRIAVDDFGTGHSSLAYLRDLPLSVLKIDRTFVARLTTDRSSLAIAASIIELARAIGVAVVAEGVETMADAELLRGLGCDAAQGWLWSPAVPPTEAWRSDVLSRRYEVTTG